ncbi:MAG: chorismate synthase [Candidatus Nanohalarchaeota archaeon]|nr:MAG: chorismate synthase [Candidatus Nanohaloarchaeota archaeon]
MSGNVFGKLFRVTTFGESHGVACGVVIDGCPAGLDVDVSDIQKELDRRRPGQSSITTARKEEDEAQILSGVFEGKATGTPIAIVVYNKGHKSGDYDNLKDVFRPGTADFSYFSKYGFRDHRGGGRASGRETLGRVAAGAVAKMILARRGISVIAHTKEVYGVKAEVFDESVIEKNPVRCADANAAVLMEKKIVRVSKSGDSVGGIVEIIVRNSITGLGEPVFDKLDALLSYGLMSIGAVKGVEVGDGFGVSQALGSFCNDEMYVDGGKLRHRTNHGGGIAGGISNGEDIVLRIAVKPTPSILKEQSTLDVSLNEKKIKIEGRHDPCICPRIVPVAEAMVALVLVDHMLRGKVARVDEL